MALFLKYQKKCSFDKNSGKMRYHLNFCKIIKCFSISTFIVLFLFPFCGYAQGDLLITPRRIVFEGNRQRQEITLANTGQETATYTVSFVQYHMTEEGSFEVITEPRPGQMFADEYLRFFPRTVTLAPNESQVIRMQLRRLPGMADGEYRSHIYFRAVPNERPLGEDEISQDSTAIGIRLTPIFGITIPAIIRIGDVYAKTKIADIKFDKDSEDGPQLSLTFLREGNQSVYGDLTVDYEDQVGKKINVGTVRGIGVYTPNSLRKFSMRLTVPDGIDLQKGRLLVKFSSANDAKPEIYADYEFSLN
jgi:hypothetical protein